MVTTQQEVIAFLTEYDVKFIRLAFFDIAGVQKNISSLVNELQAVFEHGLSFDASAITGFQAVKYATLLLFPDISTLTILPWRPQTGSVVKMFCEIRLPDGSLCPLDTRSMLKQKMHTLTLQGYQIMASTECAFYLFQRDDQGNATSMPYDHAGYCDIAPVDKGENIRREICLDLEKMGIVPERSYHEQGPGQNEIDFRVDTALHTCDNLMTFHHAVDTIAYSNGLFASFDPYPLENQPGNGLHMDFSLYSNDENLFAKEPELMSYFIAGILSKIKEITLFLNPIPSSYQRLKNDKTLQSRSDRITNSSAFIRILTSDTAHTRIELRNPDSACNAYIAFTLIIAAGMTGIQQKCSYDKNMCSLPKTLQEAITLCETSAFVHEVLPQEFVDSYVKIKKMLCE